MAKSEERRKATLAGFVPGECVEHYDVDHDEENRKVTLSAKFDGDVEPMEISVGYVDPLFWYRAGFAAGMSERGSRRDAGGGAGGAGGRIPPKP